MAITSTDTSAPARPVEKYELGMHHLAQPTLDPAATLKFYVDVMGAKITHCAASRGWRDGHYDYIHMFLDLGKGDNIAMFYYFGAKTKEDWPKVGNHHSFAANTLQELAQWADWLEANGHKIMQRNTYEVFSSIYVWDPNGRFLEIACNHRPLNEVDAEDAELTAQALVIAAAEQADKIARMWQIKATLLEERDGVSFDGPALICPNVGEFAWVADNANGTITKTTTHGNFTIHQGEGEIRLTKPADIPESLWWSSGTGGIKGDVAQFDEDALVIRA
jgi:catechol 2,3-dioxygenase-like lactoylglutathione lyase family enzyme